MGLAIPLMVQGLQSAFSSEIQADIPYWDSLLLVYAGLFLTILFGCLFGLNMKVWYKNKINYKFIFEFDPRDNLDYHEFFEVCYLDFHVELLGSKCGLTIPSSTSLFRFPSFSCCCSQWRYTLTLDPGGRIMSPPPTGP